MTLAATRDELVAAIVAAVDADVAVYEYPVRAGHQTRLPVAVTIESMAEATGDGSDIYEATIRVDIDAGADVATAYGRADGTLLAVHDALPIYWVPPVTWTEDLATDDTPTLTYRATIRGKE